MTTASKPLLPAVHYLHIPAEGEPFLQGLKCSKCSAIFIDERKYCAKCGARDALQPHKLAAHGKLVAFSVVHRSYPGIPVPFISAIVDLDGGGTLKGNLINCDIKPPTLRASMRVRLVYKQAPWGDDKGNQYMIFYFEPA